MTTVAVVGSRSMLGKELITYLENRNFEVIKVGRHESDDVFLDLSKETLELKIKLDQIEAIFFCAASFESDTAEGIRINFQVNVMGALQVLELSKVTGCKQIIYVGSISSLPGFESGSMTSYGLTKSIAEQILSWGLKKIGGSFCSIRFTQIYDTYGKCIVHQPWFGRIIAYSARGLELNLPPGNALRNFIHIDDAVKILLQAFMTLPKKNTHQEIFNIIHPESMSTREIADIAYSVFQKGGYPFINHQKKSFREVHIPGSSDISLFIKVDELISIRDGIRKIHKMNTWEKFGPLDVAASK